MKQAAVRVGFVGAFLLVWWALAQAGLWNSTLFPSPLKVGETLGHLISSGELAVATAVSLKRLLLGYLISLGVGTPLGILLARSSLARQSIGTLVVGFQALPSICWLPIALLWFGLNDSAILFVVVMGSLVSITVAVQDGVQNIPPSYVRAARTMGAQGGALARLVLAPASTPAILIGAKLGWAYAWRALMAGELLFVSLGLGHLLMMGRELADMSQVLAVMLVIMALGLGTDAMIFGPLERRMRDRWGLLRS